MNFLRKFQVYILVGVLAFFFLSIVLGFGSSFFVKGAPNDAIAVVDGDKITIRQFLVHYNRAADRARGQAITEPMRQEMIQESLRSLIQMNVFRKEADRYGLRVPDTQVVNTIGQMFQNPNTKAFDGGAYGQFLQSQAHTGPKEFEEEQRQSIAFFKLRWLLMSSLHVTDTEMTEAWAERGGEFSKQQEFEAVEGKPKRRRSSPEIQALFRQMLQDEKNNWALNQWMTQIGQKMRVKTYFERVEGQLR